MKNFVYLNLLLLSMISHRVEASHVKSFSQRVPFGVPADSFQIWKLRRHQLPQVNSLALELYVNQLGAAFYKDSRARFLAAQTLNRSIWNEGRGFFVIHVGLLSEIGHFLDFNFLLVLEMAHDVLGHGATDSRVYTIPLITKKLITRRQLKLWNGLGFGHMVIAEDINERNLFFSLEEEQAALALVDGFFREKGWDYQQTAAHVASLLSQMSPLPSYGSIKALHPFLSQAVLLNRAGSSFNKWNSFAMTSSLNADYERIKGDLLSLDMQRNSWLLQAGGFSELFTEDEVNDGEMSQEINALIRKKEIGEEAGIFLKTWLSMKTKNFKKARVTLEQFMKNKSVVAAPFLDLWGRVVSISLEMEDRCEKDFAQNWSKNDHLRKAYLVQCLYFAGRLSDALEKAQAYEREADWDPWVAFWKGLVLLRLHLPAEDFLKKTEQRWGKERPLNRALRIVEAGYLKDARKIAELTQEVEEEFYSLDEQGLLDAFRSWALYVINDFKAETFLYRAQKRWFPAYYFERILPLPVAALKTKE